MAPEWAESTGDVGTDGSGENVPLRFGEEGMLLFGSENSLRRCELVILRARSASDGMNCCSKLELGTSCQPHGRERMTSRPLGGVTYPRNSLSQEIAF